MTWPLYRKVGNAHPVLLYERRLHIEDVPEELVVADIRLVVPPPPPSLRPPTTLHSRAVCLNLVVTTRQE